MRAHLRHKAAVDARQAQNAERSRLAKAREEQEAEGRREVRLRELERRQMLAYQQDEQRRKDRQARDESAMRAHLRHEAAAKAKKAQDAEHRRLAKLREAE
jgi:hypothetical protein